MEGGMRRLMRAIVGVCRVRVFGAGVVYAQSGDAPGTETLPEPDPTGSWGAGFIYVLLLILLEYVPWFRNW